MRLSTLRGFYWSFHLSTIYLCVCSLSIVFAVCPHGFFALVRLASVLGDREGSRTLMHSSPSMLWFRSDIWVYWHSMPTSLLVNLASCAWTHGIISHILEVVIYIPFIGWDKLFNQRKYNDGHPTTGEGIQIKNISSWRHCLYILPITLAKSDWTRARTPPKTNISYTMLTNWSHRECESKICRRIFKSIPIAFHGLQQQ